MWLVVACFSVLLFYIVSGAAHRTEGRSSLGKERKGGGGSQADEKEPG